MSDPKTSGTKEASVDPPHVPEKLSLLTKLEQFYRLVAYVCCFALACPTLFLVCLAVSPLSPHNPVKRKAFYWVGRVMSSCCMVCNGLEFSVQGTEHLKRFTKPGEPAPMFFFLHGSNLDGYLTALAYGFQGKTDEGRSQFDLPCMFAVAKQSLFYIPLFGWMLSLLGFVSIDRSNLQASIKSLDVAAERVKQDRFSMGIFPEGTRRRSASVGTSHIQPFKKGPFHIWRQSSSLAVPVIIYGAHGAWPPGSLFTIPRKKVCVRIGKPLSLEEMGCGKVEGEEEEKRRLDLSLKKTEEVFKKEMEEGVGGEPYSAEEAYARGEPYDVLESALNVAIACTPGIIFLAVLLA